MRWLVGVTAVACLVGAAHADAGSGRPRARASDATRDPSDLRGPALRAYALGLCDSWPHATAALALRERARGGHPDPHALCQGDVSRRFDDCASAFLAHRKGARGFATCLGFDPPPAQPPAHTLAECVPPSVALRFAFSRAKESPWPGASLRTVGSRTLHVGPPTLTERDVTRVVLEERASERTLTVDLTPAAAQRLTRETAGWSGHFIVVAVGREEFAALLETPLAMGRLTFTAAASIAPRDVCRAP